MVMRGGCLSEAAVDAAAASLCAAESPLPPDPEFPSGADFAAEFEARFAASTAVEAPPPYPAPTDSLWVDGPDPDDLDECDLVPYAPGPVSRVDRLEWELFGAREQDAAEAAV
ncbi:MAG TPA: hypothetical protein VGJ44_00830, partial [Kribbellaceae bacterium]